MRGLSIVAMLLIAIGSAPAGAESRSGLIQLLHSAGTGGVWRFATSPDGRHVYSAGWWLGTYARDPASGVVEEVDGFVLPGTGQGLAVSPDGAHVYVSSGASGILVYARDLETGIPTPIGVTAPEGLAFTGTVAVSPDGAFLYAQSGGALLAFERDPMSGALGEPFTVAAHGGSDFAIAPDGAHLYVAGGAPNPVLDVHARDAETGALVLLDSLVQGEGGVDGLPASDVAVSPDGRDVYVVGPQKLAVFARDAATGLLAFDDAIAIGSAASAVAAGDGFAWVLQYFVGHPKDYGPQVVKAFARAEGPGGLSLLDSASITWEDFYYGGPGLADWSEIALAPDSWDAYFGDFFALGLSAGATLAPASDLLTEIQRLDDAALVGARAARVTPDGRHLVVAGPAGLAVFAHDRATGTVAPVEVETGLLEDVRDVAASPDGRFLYAADRSAGVVRFARDAASGALTAIDAASAGLTAGADAVVPSEDGTRLYAGGHGAGELALYARDETSGALAHVETVSIAQVRGLALSTDGRFLYADRSFDASRPGTTSVHAIDATGGSVDAAGIDLGPRVAVASRDGAHLYQVRQWFEPSCPFGPNVSCPDALRSSALDPATGGPGALVAETRDAPLLASGDVTQMALSRDGRFLYLARGAPSPGRQALRSCLVAFARERASGALTYADAACQPVSLFAIAPSGAHLYAIDGAGGTLRVQAPEPAAGLVSVATVAALAALGRRRRESAPR
jgi:6-phosphogluconolactonase (cycloisomerase 2 family)